MGWIIHKLVFLEKMNEASKLVREKVLKTSITLMKQIRKERKNLINVIPFITNFGIVTKRFTLQLNLALNLVAATLVTTGTIVGGVTMNPIVLGVISGLGVILKTAMEMTNLQKKIENSKVAFTSYAKVLSDLRNFLRGEEWHKEEYLQKLKTLDDMVIDMSLNWEKFVAKYKEEYDVD